ncbi:hypothetical protein [Formosa haliotis]|uniref:hypothetical protein n=1 Tax=Formosa haliotis TaxID=1555194 RepID=UPI000824CD5D|nr:hypothetical protein [Formosa haliotis]
MKTFQLKLVSFSSKGFKKQLIISVHEADVLRQFLVDSMRCEVLVINTNVGLDVYYEHETPNKELIIDAILILLAKKKMSVLDFFIHELNSKAELVKKTHIYFKRLIQHPLLFKNYSKSLCRQLNLHYSDSPNIVQTLFAIWQDELLHLNNTDMQVYVLRSFLSRLQFTYVQQSCKPELQDLIKSALDVEHRN